MRERWRSIPGVTGYQASNHGRIRSNKRVPQADKKNPNSWIILKSYTRVRGYLAVDIWSNDDCRKTCFVHQLVAKTFLAPVKGATDVDHKNYNRSDNSLTNLRYITTEENTSIAQKRRHGSD